MIYWLRETSLDRLPVVGRIVSKQLLGVAIHGQPPDLAVAVISKQLGILLGAHVARPYHLGPIDIGIVVDPVEVDVVRGAIADNDEVFARHVAEFVYHLGAAPESKRVAEPLRNGRSSLEEEQYDGGARNPKPDPLAAEAQEAETA